MPDTHKLMPIEQITHYPSLIELIRTQGTRSFEDAVFFGVEIQHNERYGYVPSETVPHRAFLSILYKDGHAETLEIIGPIMIA